jgi:hypothetical protein
MFRERSYVCVIYDDRDQHIMSRVIHAFSDQTAIERALLVKACRRAYRVTLSRGGVRVFAAPDVSEDGIAPYTDTRSGIVPGHI